MSLIGVHNDIAESLYHSGDEVSKSALDIVDRSLAHYDAKLEGGFDIATSNLMLRGSVAHCLVLEPETLESKYAVEPVIPATAYTNAESMRSAISDYNKKLLTPMPTDSIKKCISEYNLSLTAQKPTNGNQDEVLEIYMTLPDCYQIVNSEKPKVTEYKAAIKQYNATLPKPLKTSGNREALLDTLAGFNPELAAEERQIPDPLSTGGTLADLAERVRVFEPEAVFEHELIADWKSQDDKTLVPRAMFEQCESIAKAVHAHKTAGLLLDGGIPEISFYWNDSETGLACRGRADYYNAGALFDLKVVGDSSEPRHFAKKVANMRYHVQDAFYRDGFNLALEQSGNENYYPIEEFYFIAVEAEYPHVVTVCKLSDEAVEVGRRGYRQNLNDLAYALMEDQFPGYADGIVTIELPGYANKYNAKEGVL